jgi:OPT family oligopeptide transporter
VFDVAEHPPDAPQLTARAAITGVALGGLLCLSNLYVALKTGWSLGVTITACIIAYALFAFARAVGLTRSSLGDLENNAVGTVASAAGYMTGGGNVAALPALLMLTDLRPSTAALVAWFASTAALGVFVAIPLKRQLINIEELPFPTGAATAETIRSLHDHRGKQARPLFAAAAIAGITAWLRDALRLPPAIGLPFRLAGQPALRWTLGFETSLLLVGAGAFVGARTGWSLLLGGVVNYALLAPWLHARGVIAGVSYREIVGWSAWAAAGVLVSSALVALAAGPSRRAIARSLGALAAAFERRARATGARDPSAALECPRWWFAAAVVVLGAAVVVLMQRIFHVPLWAGVVAIPLAVAMGFVSARVTGETDTSPSSALGPVTQLAYGALVPGNVAANLAGANVTAGVALHASDLLTDLKAGFLLGARPRQQLAGQLLGVLAGAALVAPALHLLVPDVRALGSEALPAPGAMVWAGVARVLARGPGALAPAARAALAVGAGLGAVLALLERAATPRARRFVPSPSGIGIALVLPAYNSASMAIGALAAWAWRRRQPAGAPDRIAPLAAGLVAGESLVGVALALLAAVG